MPMRKLIFLTSAMMLLATPALAKDVKRVISPEDLFQEAKKRCPANATTPEGWAELRKCIAKAKGEIINEKDRRIAKACEKYSGEERDQCTGIGTTSRVRALQPTARCATGRTYRSTAPARAASAGELQASRPIRPPLASTLPVE
jgi:hypothetical protein